MRRASLVALVFAAGVSLAPGLSSAEDPKLPEETKDWKQSQRARLVSVWGGYAWKHATDVTFLAFSGDGRTVIAGDERALVLRERASGREQKVLSVSGPSTLSPDGKKLLVSGEELLLLDIASGKKAWSADRARRASFAHDGKRVIALGATTATIYDERGKEVRTLRVEGGVDFAVLSPDGKRALLGDTKRLALFDVAHAKKVGTLESDAPLTAIEWTTEVLVTGAADGKVRAWDQEKLTTVWERAHAKAVVALAVSGRKVAAVSEDGALVVRDTAGNQLRAFQDPARSRALAFSPDGLTVASARTMVELWSLETGARLTPPDLGHEGPVLALAVSPDRLHVLSGSSDHTARVWNVATARALHVLDHGDGSIASVAFSPDGKEALAGDENGSLELWDMKEGADLHRFASVGPVGAVGFGPNVLRAATLEGELRFFERTKLRKSLDLGTKAGRAPVTIAGKLALVANEKGAVKVWDLESGREVRTLDGRDPLRAVTASSSGKRALTGGKGLLRLFDLQAGTELRTLDLGALTVTALAISADDKLGLVATEEGKVGLWDLEAGKLVDQVDFASARDHARSVVFTQEGFVVGTARGVVLRFEWVGA